MRGLDRRKSSERERNIDSSKIVGENEDFDIVKSLLRYSTLPNNPILDITTTMLPKERENDSWSGLSIMISQVYYANCY
jgi:hypothetical protein